MRNFTTERGKVRGGNGVFCCLNKRPGFLLDNVIGDYNIPAFPTVALENDRFQHYEIIDLYFKRHNYIAINNLISICQIQCSSRTLLIQPVCKYYRQMTAGKVIGK